MTCPAPFQSLYNILLCTRLPVLYIPLQVAFPYLYNNRPRKVRLSVYHHPMVMYIKAEDPDLPAFYYDPLIHPIAFYKSESAAGAPPAGGPDAVLDEEDEEWALPDGIEPFLAETPLYSETTAQV